MRGVIPRTLRVVLSCLALFACGDDLPEDWEIRDYRLLAVVSEPPEVSPDGAVVLTVADFDPEGRPVRYAWRLCLFSLGSAVNFECADPSLLRPLSGNGPTTQVDFSPDGLNLRALYETFGPVPDAAGQPRTLSDGFYVYVEVVATSESGKVERAYKRVWIRDGEDLNTNPDPVGWRIDDAPPAPVPAGETVKLMLELGDAPREVDPDGFTETYLYQWLCVEGWLDADILPGAAVDYETPERPGTYPVFVIVRDRRGGTSFERLDVVVAP